MAYSVKYQSTISRFGTDEKITIQILKNNYVGGYEIFHISAGSAQIIFDTTEYFDEIATTSAQFEIVNKSDDHFHYDELFSVNEFEFMVKIFDTNFTYFEGYIPCETGELEYLSYGTFIINTSNNLKRLSEFKPTELVLHSGVSLITIIKNCLSKTGLTLPIYVNNSLFEVGMELDGNPYFPGTPTKYTIFDGAFVSSDLFLDDDIVYQDCGTILRKILCATSSKLYYWNNAWYIERVKDLGKTSKTYVVYNINGTITTSIESDAPINIGASAVQYCNANQRRIFNPGVKQIKMNLEEFVKLNLLNYNYNLIANGGTDVDSQNPNYMQWTKDSYLTSTSFYNKNKIVSGIHVENLHRVDGSTNDNFYTRFNDISPESDAPIGYPEYREDQLRNSVRGLYTKFKFTQNGNIENGEENTELTLSFKFTLPENFINYSAPLMTQIRNNPSDHLFFIRFFLKYYSDSNRYYIRYNEETNKYYAEQKELLYDDLGDIDAGLIEVSVPFANFTNQYTYTHEFNTSIVIEDFSIDYGRDWEMILGLCEIGYNIPTMRDDKTIPHWTLKHSNFGDIVMTVNYEEQDNVHVGTLNDNFVTIQNVDLSLYDSYTYNLLNTLYRNIELTERTLSWGDDFYESEMNVMLLVQKLIEDRFQIYNSVRKGVSTDLYYKSPLRPFTMLNDSHFEHLLMLNGFRWVFESNILNSVDLKEYVRNDNIS
jgi:hypothetical protein